MQEHLSLLIIDDDADDRLLFIDAVKQFDENIRCTEVINGEQALALLKDPHTNLPDCIFLDLRMPRISGKTCLKEIKDDERLRDIPVYIYSTSREVEESKALKAMGATHFISKPNNEDEVYYLIACAIEEQLRINNQYGLE